MTIALYARTSTKQQSVEGQLEKLRAYERHRGAEGVEYTDHGVSGAKAKRPGLDALLAAVRRREVEAVVCTKLDRIARSTVHLHTLVDELEEHDCALVVLDQTGIDTGTTSGRLVLDVLAAVAAFERALILERVGEGKARAQARGVRFGRPNALGPKEVRRAQRLRASGHSVRAIAERLGVGSSTVQRALGRR